MCLIIVLFVNCTWESTLNVIRKQQSRYIGLIHMVDALCKPQIKADIMWLYCRLNMQNVKKEAELNYNINY